MVNVKKSNLAFPSSCTSKNKDRVTHCHEFLQLHHLTAKKLSKGNECLNPSSSSLAPCVTPDLEDECLFRLQPEICSGLPNSLLKVTVPLSLHRQAWEQISQEAEEDGHILGDNLGHVEVSQRTHQDLERAHCTFRPPPNITSGGGE